MTETPPAAPPADTPPPAPARGVPVWVTATVVLGLLGLLGFNIITAGPDGYPTSVILGGLLGAYAGIEQLVKRK